MAWTGLAGSFLGGNGAFVHWGVLQISVANLAVIGLMIVVFVLALVVPFGHATTDIRPAEPAPAVPTVAAVPPPGGFSWTERLRDRLLRVVPAGQLLPARQPAYVASWIYVFGVLCLAALVMIVATGAVLAVAGTTWWHISTLGHFVNSLHLWSVEVFFFTMVVHLWGKFFMAAWRGRRTLTWMTGVVAFAGSIGAAFTGYLVQTNFDSQWIATQAKDGLNSVGVGAWFNVLNTGQMLLWHVMLLPLVLGVVTVAHVLLVRRHGVVPPIGVAPPETSARAAPAPGALAVSAGSGTSGVGVGAAAAGGGQLRIPPEARR